MDNIGAQPEADPFAPVTGAVIPPGNPKNEVWEPQIPAPGDPPPPEAISHSRFGRASRQWIYRDGDGQPLFSVARFDLQKEDGTKAKEMLPYTYGRRAWTTPSGSKRDKTAWHFKRPGAPVPLYGLDRLAARPAAQVIVCEGEKAADAAERHFSDAVGVTSQGGSKAVSKADWSPLAGRQVVIWPDNDKPGAKYADDVAHHLREAGAGNPRVVPVPAGWPEGWDLADALPDGVEPEALEALLRAAAPARSDEPQEEDEEPTTPAVSPEEIAAEVDRLSRLPGAEYAQERKRAAQRLRMGVGDLDKAVKGAKARRRGEAEAAHRALSAPGPGETLWPLDIFVGEDGLYADTGADEGPVWLCAPITVLGEGRDASNEAWSLYLKWHDRDGHPHTWPMPKKMLMVQPGELEAALSERGLSLDVEPASRALLRKALNGVQSGSRVTLVSQPGWHAPGNGDSAFVLLNGETIGAAAEALVLKAQPENANQKMAAAGTLEGWKSTIAAKAEGNPVAAFAICAAFAGPLLDPLGESSGGFHFFGRSKTGKTLALRMALSVWGPPKKSGLLKDWRSTANGLEGAAEESNDGLLTLDEIHQADAREVVGGVYQLANESGKQRLNREAVSKVRRTWRTVVLSTGEVDVAAMAAKAGQKLPAGADVRLPSIHLDGQDFWPNLHGATSSDALMAELQQSLQLHYGTPIRAFLSRLTVERNDPDNGMDVTIEIVRDLLAALLPEGADPQVRDVARRCALIALAGEMAIDWGILPWKEGEAIRHAETILKWWLGRRGGAGSSEESQHVKAVRAFLAEHGSSRFAALDWQNNPDTNKGKWIERHPDRPVPSRAGWRRNNGDGDQYLILPDAWSDLCSKAGVDPVETAKTMEAAGFLSTLKDGKNLTKSLRVPGLGKARFYVVEPAIFADATAPIAQEAAE